MPDLLKVKFKQTWGFVGIELALLMVLLVGLASGSILVQQNQDVQKYAQQRVGCKYCNTQNRCVDRVGLCNPDFDECLISADCGSPPSPTPPADNITPKATPTRANVPDHCNGCWVAKSSFCVGIKETNSGYICCPSIEGGRNYPHFEKGSTCGSTPTPGVPKNEKECFDADSCWVQHSSVCVGRHKENAGYKCCDANEGRLVNFPHFEKITEKNPDPCVVISTPTPAVPTLKPCSPVNTTGCINDNKSAALCVKQEDGSLGWLEYVCNGNTVCGEYTNKSKNVWFFTCISMTPSPPASPVPSSTAETSGQTNSSNLLSLFQRILEFFTFKGKAL